VAIKEVDPVSRIEGHLGLTLTTTVGGYTTGCDAHGNLWRGFENFLIGRQPNDAITFVQRICGVCPVPHGLTSTYAVDDVFGYSDGYTTFSDGGTASAMGIPPKAVHIRNMVLGCEFLMSSLTHFYHLAAPSYIQGPAMAPWTPYFNDAYYHPYMLSAGKTLTGSTLWNAVINQYVEALRIRRLTFEAGALFAGRMPMTSALVAGGVLSEAADAAFNTKCDTMFSLLSEVGTFIVQKYVPLVLALGALYPNFDNFDNADWLNTNAVALWTAGNKDTVGAPTAAKTGWGAGLGNFLAWGGFPQPNVADEALALPGGFVINAAAATPITGALMTAKSSRAAAIQAVKDNLIEDTAESRYVADAKWGYTGGNTWAYPGAINRTEPDRQGGYTWMKAPRWKNGSTYYSMEVGPLARMVVAGFIKCNGTAASRKLATTVAIPGYFDYASYTDGAGNLDTSGQAADAALLASLTDANGGGENIQAAVALWLLNVKGGLSTMDRLRGRAIESLFLVQKMIGAYVKGTGFGSAPAAGSWLKALKDIHVTDSRTYKAPGVLGTVSGFGATEAPRGALAHFISIAGNKITAYQCVVPTTWNGSPKDGGIGGASAGLPGAIEAAVINSKYAGLAKTLTPADGVASASVATEGGVEALRIAQSFDPCIACAIH
jgi:Ni,Fe-hydrogenase I large subunit